MNKTTLISMLLATSMLGGCMTTVTPGSPEAYMQMEKERKERAADQLEDTLDDMPKWYKKVPTSNHAVYAAGSSTSTDPQYAIEKAVLRAKITLADRLNGQLRQKMKSVMAENDEIGTSVTKNVIDGVEVSGYRLKEKELLVENGEVRAYVLLEFPIGGFNDVLKYKADQEAKLNKQKIIAEALKD